MSYLRKRYGRTAVTGLGDTIATLASTAADPYLSEVICRVGQLKAIENHEVVPPCATTPPNLGGGVGLRRVMPALRGYVYAEQHAWVYPAVIGTVIGFPLLIGYLIARRGS